MTTDAPHRTENDVQTIARQSFMSLWQGYCDLKQLARDLMALVEGKCPDCGHDELHSALVEGKEGVSCTECEWAKSYDSLRSQVP
jgi:hypothetical protein